MVNPVLVLLLLVLLGLLAFSVGYRRQRSAVEPLRRIVEGLRELSRENPDRFAPSLALNLRLLGVELLESGRPYQALSAVMSSVDLYRTLAQRYPARYEDDLTDSLDVEEALKVAIGFDPSMDLHALIEAEAMADYAAGEHRRARTRRGQRAFLWETALVIWLLSVMSFLIAAL